MAVARAESHASEDVAILMADFSTISAEKSVEDSEMCLRAMRAVPEMGSALKLAASRHAFIIKC